MELTLKELGDFEVKLPEKKKISQSIDFERRNYKTAGRYDFFREKNLNNHVKMHYNLQKSVKLNENIVKVNKKKFKLDMSKMLGNYKKFLSKEAKI